MTASEVSKPAPTSLVVRRTFEAPVDRVFDAWLTPEIMRTILAATQKVNEVTIDPRVGGSYSIAWDTDEGVWCVGGIYREIVKNERIVFTWTWDEDDPADVVDSLVSLEFRSLGPKKTELVLTHTNLRDEKSRDGHASGWPLAVDKLAEIIE